MTDDGLSGLEHCPPATEASDSAHRRHSEEARFLSEVETYIGNPDDWIDSDDESIPGDLSAVRVLERGLVDEQGSEEELVELEEESYSSSSSPSPSTLKDLPHFLYENDSGMFSESSKSSKQPLPFNRPTSQPINMSLAISRTLEQ